MPLPVALVLLELVLLSVALEIVAFALLDTFPLDVGV